MKFMNFIKGKIRSTIYKNDNGFFVGTFRVKETNDEFMKDYINKTITITGTLLDPNNKILPETKAALIACQKQGTKLVLASGRSYTRLLSYAKELEMDVYGGYLLEVDGIAYYDVQKDERHVLKQMYKEDVEPVFAYLMHKNCETMAIFNDGLFDYIPDLLSTLIFVIINLILSFVFVKILSRFRYSEFLLG